MERAGIQNRYASIGAFFSNIIQLPGRESIGPFMGGAGLYALSALLFGTENVFQIGAAGTDFDRYFGAWFDANGCSRHALYPYKEKNEMSIMVYGEDGTYRCESAYGPRFRERLLPLIQLRVEQIIPYMQGLRGLYSCGNWSREDCVRLAEAGKRTGTAIMWEMPTELQDGPVEQVLFLAQHFDLWSLNRTESFRLFGLSSEEDVCQQLVKIGNPCYYRVGKKGAYMVAQGQVAFVPTVHVVPESREIDPTGCGNSSTAAAMWAYLEGYSPLETCVWANTVAGFTVQQYGPYPCIDDAARRRARSVYERTLSCM